MENTEITQQEKQGIFETAQLKTIVSKTLEEKVERIKKGIIDITKYRGLIHFTQMTNITSILLNGLESSYAKRKEKIGFGGRSLLDSRSPKREGIWFAELTDNIRDVYLHRWASAGPIVLLFDESQMKLYSNKFFDHKADKEFFITNITIPKTIVKALVVNSYPCFLDRFQKESLFFNKAQVMKITSNRLSRLLNNKKDAHLVPLYDHFGNVLWPEKIPYDEVQKIVSQRKN